MCRALAAVLPLFMRRPPLTASAIAGVVNDADLDPTSAMNDLGYAPLAVRAGFHRCYPLAAKAATSPLRARALAKGQAR
jgi:NADH dehydrogenase